MDAVNKRLLQILGRTEQEDRNFYHVTQDAVRFFHSIFLGIGWPGVTETIQSEIVNLEVIITETEGGKGAPERSAKTLRTLFETEGSHLGNRREEWNILVVNL